MMSSSLSRAIVFDISVHIVCVIAVYVGPGGTCALLDSFQFRLGDRRWCQNIHKLLTSCSYDVWKQRKVIAPQTENRHRPGSCNSDPTTVTVVPAKWRQQGSGRHTLAIHLHVICSWLLTVNLNYMIQACISMRKSHSVNAAQSCDALLCVSSVWYSSGCHQIAARPRQPGIARHRY